MNLIKLDNLLFLFHNKYKITMLWLIQCVASWFHDNENCPVKGAYMKFEQVLLIQGIQGLSKTKLFLSIIYVAA